jgi:hypothetical protein
MLGDGRSHLKNSDVTKHDGIWTYHSLQSNETVERINKDVLEVLKSLPCEFEMTWDKWMYFCLSLKVLSTIAARNQSQAKHSLQYS